MQLRKTHHFKLNRLCHCQLDFFRIKTKCLGVDDDLDIGDVWHSIDREIVDLIHRHQKKQDGESDDPKLIT